MIQAVKKVLNRENFASFADCSHDILRSALKCADKVMSFCSEACRAVAADSLSAAWRVVTASLLSCSPERLLQAGGHAEMRLTILTYWTASRTCPSAHSSAQAQLAKVCARAGMPAELQSEFRTLINGA